MFALTAALSVPISTSRSDTWARQALATRRSPRHHDGPLHGDAVIGQSSRHQRQQPILRLRGMLAPGRDGIDFDPTLGGNAHELVQIARSGFLDVGGRVRRDPFVQHRFVVEAGQHRDRSQARRRQTIQLDGENRAEFLQGLEHTLGVSRVAVHQNQPQIPIPAAVGSRSQSGGVSQTNARMAITHRS